MLKSYNRLLPCLALCFCFVMQSPVLAQAQTYKVLLLAGQSNMVGQGDFDLLDASLKKRLAVVADRVLVSENGSKLKPLTYRSVTPSQKYAYDKAFGPEIMLGVLLAEHYPTETFVFVKDARGGTSLEGAWNPHWNAEKAKIMERTVAKQTAKLFSEHVSHINAVVEGLKSKNSDVEFIGLVWLQGENDAKTYDSANNYGDNLNKLVEAYRSQFNSNMPFVFAQTNSRYGKKGAPEIVRKQMLDYANGHANVVMIPSSTDTTWLDFPKHLDNVHYNALGQERMGTAMAKALISLQQDQ